MLLVHHQQAELLAGPCPPSRRVPTTTSTEPSARLARTSRAWALVRNWLSSLDPKVKTGVAVGEGLARRPASSVVGTDTPAW